MDIICVALLAEQYGPNTQYSWCGKAHLLAQGHYGLYEECITLVKNLMFLWRRRLTHRLLDVGVLCEVVGRFSPIYKGKWKRNLV